MASNLDKLSQSMADFAVNLYKKASEEVEKDDNVFLSPFSVVYALAMTYAGAQGKTKDEMKEIMFGKTDLDDHGIHDVFAEIMTALNKPDAAYKLHIANRIYAHQPFVEKLLDAYVQLVAKKYHSDLQLTNFNESNGEVARGLINTWVSQKTNDKIQDLIPSGILNEETRLVLVNAIYFKGDWLKPFPEDLTKEEPFYASPNKELKLQTMKMHSVSRAYAETDEYQLIGLPYEGQELAMFIFLPKDRYGLDKFEKNMTGKTILDAILSTHDRELSVIQMPKFKLTQQFSLSKALQAMGAKTMFDGEKADFSGITGKRDLYVSEVIHKAFVEVNEKGTEAAGASAVVMAVAYSLVLGPRIPPPKFIADHPFIFSIFDYRSQNILFLGRYNGQP